MVDDNRQRERRRDEGASKEEKRKRRRKRRERKDIERGEEREEDTRKGSGGRGAEISPKRSSEGKKKKGKARRKKRKEREKGKEDGTWEELQDCDEEGFGRSNCGFGKCSEQNKLEVSQGETKTMESCRSEMQKASKTEKCTLTEWFGVVYGEGSTWKGTKAPKDSSESSTE